MSTLNELTDEIYQTLSPMREYFIHSLEYIWYYIKEGSEGETATHTQYCLSYSSKRKELSLDGSSAIVTFGTEAEEGWRNATEEIASHAGEFNLDVNKLFTHLFTHLANKRDVMGRKIKAQYTLEYITGIKIRGEEVFITIEREGESVIYDLRNQKTTKTYGSSTELEPGERIISESDIPELSNVWNKLKEAYQEMSRIKCGE